MGKSWVEIGYRWHWLEDGLLPWALAGMRALWLGVLLRLLAATTWPAGLQPPPTGLLFALLLAATLLAQWGTYGRLEERWSRLLLGVVGLLAVVLTLYLWIGRGSLPLWDVAWMRALIDVPGPLSLTFLASILCWWWGILAGRDRLGYDTYAGNFTLGLSILALCAAISYAGDWLPLRDVLLPLLGFFALGLGAMALSSLGSIQVVGVKRLTISRYWLITVAGIIGGVLLMGVFLGRLFVPEYYLLVQRGLGMAWDLVVQVLLWLIYRFVWLIFLVLEPLIRYLQSLRPEGQQVEMEMPLSFAEQLAEFPTEPAALPPTLFLLLRIAALLLLAAIVVGIFILAYRRFRAYLDDDVEVTRESIFSADLLREQLAGLFRRRSSQSKKDPFAALSGETPEVRIRRTYQHFLAWGAGCGLPRQPGQTPAEYARALTVSLSVPSGASTQLTHFYGLARYGYQVGEADADAAWGCWQEILAAKRNPT